MIRSLTGAALVAVGFAAGWGLAMAHGYSAGNDAGGRMHRVHPRDGAISQNVQMEKSAGNAEDGAWRHLHRDGDAENGVTVEGVRGDERSRPTESDAASASVEDVLDEDGQTVDERAVRFAREQPDACAALARRRERLRAARQTAAADRRAFLESVADEFLSADRRAAHADYLMALETRDRLREKLAEERLAGRPVAVEDQNALTEAERTLRDGAASERQALFEAVARSVGLDGADVSAFVETLAKIVETL